MKVNSKTVPEHAYKIYTLSQNSSGFAFDIDAVKDRKTGLWYNQIKYYLPGKTITKKYHITTRSLYSFINETAKKNKGIMIRIEYGNPKDANSYGHKTFWVK